MTWHPTDDDLILRLYDETRADHARRIDAHVAGCGSCRRSWDELVQTLKLVDAAEVPEPGPAFERVLWAHLQDVLPAPVSPARSWRQWAPAVGLAATVVLAVAAGYQWGVTAPVPEAAEERAAEVRERVLLTALGGHFEQAEMLLVELMNAPDAGADQIELRRATADDLVASGRLYRVTAEDTGDVQMAHMLEDLESVLVDLALAPPTSSPADLQSLRTRIGEEDLIFKVRAVTSQLRGRTTYRTESE